MNKFFFLLTILLCTSMDWAHAVIVHGINYNLNRSNNTAQVIPNDGNRYTGYLSIPERISVLGYTYDVTSLGDNCFSHCKGLTSIGIPNSVTSLDMLSGGYYAFSGGTLCKAASSSTALGGFRWYVSVTDRATGLPVSPAALPAKMRIVENEGGEATGFAAAPAAAPLLKDAPVYDLNGRRIGKADAMDALPKGVYIVNGKKVIR